MRRLFLALGFSAGLISSAFAADSSVPSMTAGAAMSDTDLLYCAQSSGTTDRKCTAAQIKTYANTSAVDARTTTTEAVITSDQNKAVTFTNASAVAASIAVASSGTFFNGWATTLINEGDGTVTLTPTTSTVDGAATLTLATGQSVDLYSDGTNYFTARGRSAGGSPGGSSGNLQYNNSGSFGGVPTVNGDGTLNTATGALAVTKTGGVSFGSLATQSSVSLAQVGLSPYTASNFYTPYFLGGGLRTATQAGIANTIRCHSAYFKGQATIDQLGARVTTIAASGNFSVAIYAVGANGKPTGSALANSGSLSTGVAGQIMVTGLSQQLGSATQALTPVAYCINNDTTAGTTVVFAGYNTDATFLAADTGTATAANLLGTGGTNPIGGWTLSGQTCCTWPSLTAASFNDANGQVISGFHILSVP